MTLEEIFDYIKKLWLKEPFWTLEIHCENNKIVLLRESKTIKKLK